MNDAKDSVGPPRREVKESKAREKFSSYMAAVTSLRDQSLLPLGRHPHIRFGEMP